MKFKIDSYLIVGRENTNGRPLVEVVRDAVNAGFTFLQLRSKVESAREMIEDCVNVSNLLKEMGKSNEVCVVVNDRLDIILAARELGAKIDGIHVGQKDIPVSVCRKYLGKDAVIGLSAPKRDLINYARNCDAKDVDYFGAGPVHETKTKPDVEKDESGKQILKSIDELKELAQVSPVPVVVGGGVKLEDIKPIKETGVNGFFVISAVTNAENPYEAAKLLVDAWNS